MSKAVVKQDLKTEALKMALPDRRIVTSAGNPEDYINSGWNECLDAIDALAEQPAQREPVAWLWRCKPYCNWPEWSVSLKRPADSGRDGHKRTEGYEDVPLYTAPPQRKPLTDEEIKRMAAPWFLSMYWPLCNTFARAIEAAHGIKGDA